MKTVNIYTDGACRGNPGPGGWGVLIEFGNITKEYFGGNKETTNNQMELRAAIEGLNALTESCDVNLTTDSKYVMQGITSWISNWKQNNWKNSRSSFSKLIEELNQKNLSEKAIFRHALMGRINLSLTLFFFELHFNHHLKQINKRITSFT